jgi:pimeloyl-CoA dehydrogenase
MHMQLTAEHRQLEDVVTRLLADRYGFGQRQKIVESPQGWCTEMWFCYAEMGLLGIVTAPAYGGISLGASALLPVMQAFGRAITVEPFLASAVLAASALGYSVDEALKQRLLPEMTSGRHVAAFAHEEDPSIEAPVTATQDQKGWTLVGRKVLVIHGATADSLVVSALNEHRQPCLFWVDGSAGGMKRRGYRLIDQGSAAEIDFEHAPATVILSASDGAAKAINSTVGVGISALCAEASGVMRAALDLTSKYLATRKQFGRCLADFQVLRHRLAEMVESTETCEAMSYLAAISMDAPDSVYPERDLAQAKLLIGRHGRKVGEQAIQLHGGIGMTDEYAVGHYLQRITVIDALLGNHDQHLEILLRLSESA